MQFRLKICPISIFDLDNLLFAGIIGYHPDKIRRYRRASICKISDLQDLLLPHVLGHRVDRRRPRSHFPASSPQLYR